MFPHQSCAGTVNAQTCPVTEIAGLMAMDSNLQKVSDMSIRVARGGCTILAPETGNLDQGQCLPLGKTVEVELEF